MSMAPVPRARGPTPPQPQPAAGGEVSAGRACLARGRRKRSIGDASPYGCGDNQMKPHRCRCLWLFLDWRRGCASFCLGRRINGVPLGDDEGAATARRVGDSLAASPRLESMCMFIVDCKEGGFMFLIQSLIQLLSPCRATTTKPCASSRFRHTRRTAATLQCSASTPPAP
jgi:hypothetical protein